MFSLSPNVISQTLTTSHFPQPFKKKSINESRRLWSLPFPLDVLGCKHILYQKKYRYVNEILPKKSNQRESQLMLLISILSDWGIRNRAYRHIWLVCLSECLHG